MDDKKILNEQEIAGVSGGTGAPESIDSLEELEGSPIFRNMSSLLRHYKLCGHEMDALMAETIQNSARSYGYRIDADIAAGFVEKYWELV